MRRRALLLAVLVVVAGCSTVPASTDSPTASPARGPTVASPSAASPETSPSATATPPETASAEFVLAAGEGVARFESVTLTLAVAFAAGSEGQCADGMRDGPHEPSPVPTPTPDGDPDVDCLRFGEFTVDLTDLDGQQSLGRFTVPANAVDSEVLLVVRNVTGRLENGSRVTIHDDDFVVERRHPGTGAETYGVRFELTESSRSGVDYELGTEPVLVEDVSTPVHYAASIRGAVGKDAEMTVTVTRNGSPAAATLSVTGATNDRYHTGDDGSVTLRIRSPAVVEIEVDPAN